MANPIMSTTKVFQTKIAEMEETSGVQVLHSGRTFGWLRKKIQRFGISRYSPRFFTLDFDKQILYYSHSEFGKKISMPTPFCEILGVEPVAGTGGVTESDEDMEGRLQRRSCKLCLPRITKDKQHSFVVYTKAKHIELSSSSANGSQKWIATMKAAMLLGKEKLANDEVDSEQSTQAFSRESSVIHDSEQSSKWSSMTYDMEQSSEPESEEPASDETFEVDQFELDQNVDSPLCKVPTSSIAEPGRCLSGTNSTSSSILDHSLSPSSGVVGLPTPPLPHCCSAVSKHDAIDDGEEEEPASDTSDDLQTMLVDAVLSQPSSSYAWKRPQQPTIEKPPKPSVNISPCPSIEESQLPLPTIAEETTPRADDVTNTCVATPAPQTHLTLRERFIARGVKIPRDIKTDIS